MFFDTHCHIHMKRFEGEDALIGTYQMLTITGSTTWSLTGELKD